MEKISWPVSYDHFNFRGKDYVFFGDVHTLENICTENCKNKKICWDLETFLVDLCQKKVSNKEYIDIFLEMFYGIEESMFKSLNTELPTYIMELAKSPSFLKCWSDDKTQCPFNPYARMHYTDVRFLKTMTKKGDAILPDPLDFIEKYPNTRIEVAIFNNLFKQRMIHNVIDFYFDSDDFSSDIYKYLSKNVKIGVTLDNMYRWKTLKIHPIRKQYIKLQKQDFELAKLIRSYIKKRIEDSIVDNEIVERFEASDLEDLEDLKDTIAYVGSDISSSLIDSYLLLRLFRKFDSPSQTAIIYAGLDHVKSYSDFFQEILKCEPLTSINNPGAASKKSKCLDGKPLAHLFHTPIYQSNSNDYLYGKIMAGKRFVFEKDGKSYYIDEKNANQVLQVGYDSSRYYIPYGEYDRIYFDSQEFLKGYGDPNVIPIENN